MTRLALIIDLKKCILCHSCTVACKMHHGVPLGLFWTEVFTVGPNGQFPHTGIYGFPRVCMQCGNPPCVSVCPAKATEKDESTGIVSIDEEKCVGCRACIVACPYGARSRNPVTRTTFKCDLCSDRIQRGIEPICVKTCVGEARFFGDIEDPDSEVYRLIHQENAIPYLAYLGTDPSTRYISP